MPSFMLRLEQAGFAAVTITDQGAGDANTAVGAITFNGSYGTFLVATPTGISKPVIGNGTTQAQLDLNVVVSTATGGKITITLADTDFSFPSSTQTLASSVGGVLSAPAGSSGVFQTWANDANLSPLPGGPPTLIPAGSVTPGPLGPFGPGSFSGTAATAFTGTAPYSIFSQATFDLAGSGNASADLFTDVTGQAAVGRMTGGGSIFTMSGDLPGGNIRVTHGFELHCDPAVRPNRLQINIHTPARDRFHLENLTSATCIDDPAIAPPPPAAPFDTYIGVGNGRFNGVSGYTINWTFTDAGEPGTSDTAKYLIWLDSNSNGIVDGSEVPVLQTGPKTLTFGNHQAHKSTKTASTTTLDFWTAHADTKIDPGVWPPTGWTKNTRVKSAFSRAGSSPYVSLGNDSLGTALGYAGGSTLTGAAQTLLNIGTETLLSASHPQVVYPLTADQVRSQVNTALASQDVATILTAASQLQELDAVKYWITEVSPLQGAGNAADGDTGMAVLTPEQLQPIVVEAIARWQAAGVDEESLHALGQISYQVADLPAGYLGMASATTIWLDQNAAGHGWFIDPTPKDDAEFSDLVADHELHATPGSPAWGKMDLLTVVAHESGHVLGLDHDSDEAVMAETLATSVRRVPALQLVGWVQPSLEPGEGFLAATDVGLTPESMASTALDFFGSAWETPALVMDWTKPVEDELGGWLDGQSLGQDVEQLPPPGDSLAYGVKDSRESQDFSELDLIFADETFLDSLFPPK